MALYPVAIQAAQLLGLDADLITRLQAAIPKIPPLPRTAADAPNTLLLPAVKEDRDDVIAESYLPAKPNHNAENIGLEAVWPYDLIGDTSPLFALAQRTYAHRPFSAVADWSFDPIQAARLGLGNEVKSTLVKITEQSQHTPNGFANWDKQYGEFYVEQVGVVAAALQESLVQDYDGVIRIAPAIPPGWDFDGSVFVRDNTKVDVQVRNGVVTTAVIEVGSKHTVRVRNPWPGHPVDVVTGNAHMLIVKGSIEPIITFLSADSTSYHLWKHAEATITRRIPSIAGTPARTARSLGKVQIGLFKDNQ